MTQENKDLLLKDLCARLPYGVKCAYFDIKDKLKVGELLTIWCKEKRVFIDKLSIDHDGCDCVGVIPYLFPLSSMTEEQEKEYNSIIYHDIELHCERYYDVIDVDYYDELHDFYNKYHFDYRGLIPMGLANDATGLNIY